MNDITKYIGWGTDKIRIRAKGGRVIYHVLQSMLLRDRGTFTLLTIHTVISSNTEFQNPSSIIYLPLVKMLRLCNYKTNSSS